MRITHTRSHPTGHQLNGSDIKSVITDDITRCSMGSASRLYLWATTDLGESLRGEGELLPFSRKAADSISYHRTLRRACKLCHLIARIIAGALAYNESIVQWERVGVFHFDLLIPESILTEGFHCERSLE